MKKACKKVDITNLQTILPFVEDCVGRHATRSDFGKMLLQFGMSEENYKLFKRSRTPKFHKEFKRKPRFLRIKLMMDLEDAMDAYQAAIVSIAEYVIDCIKNRTVSFKPIVYGERDDPTTGKVRLIGKEEPLQQVFDYVAVRSCEELFNRKIVPQQASSIKGRGQQYGVRIIKRWISADNRSARWAHTHNRRYSRKCKFFVKLDIKKCYPSAKLHVFMNLLRHDCGNEDIIWLWETILLSHQVDGYTGFMIGSFPSQWAMQYMLSYAYRFVMGLVKYRRDKRIKLVSHCIFFMDDIALFGSSRKELKKAVLQLIEYIKNELSLDVKPNWCIHELEGNGVDMMGFVVHKSGKVIMRARNYIKARRMVLRYKARGSLALRQAKRLISYKGCFKHSNCLRSANLKYRLTNIFRYAANLISKEAKNIKKLERRKSHAFDKGYVYGTPSRGFLYAA